MKEDNIFKKLIKKFPCVSLMLLIIIITLLIVAFIYIINSSVFSNSTASVISASIAIVALIAIAFVLDYLVKYFEKRSELKEKEKPVVEEVVVK